MGNKLTYNKWLHYYENFNSVTHFKRYVNSLSDSPLVREEIHQYYKDMYNEWLLSELEEVI